MTTASAAAVAKDRARQLDLEYLVLQNELDSSPELEGRVARANAVARAADAYAAALGDGWADVRCCAYEAWHAIDDADRLRDALLTAVATP